MSMLKKAIQVLAWRVRVTLIGHKRTGWGLLYWWDASSNWRDWDDARCGLNCPHETVSEEIYAATN